MKDISKGQGRTVLFVSHNMSAINNLCSRCVIIEKGKLTAEGNTNKIVEQYLSRIESVNNELDLKETIDKIPEDSVIKINNIFVGQDNVFTTTVLNNKDITIQIDYLIKEKISGLRIYFDIVDIDQNILIRSFHDEHDNKLLSIIPGSYSSRAIIPRNLLGPIQYRILIRASIFNVRNCIDGINIDLKVLNSNLINRVYPTDHFRAKMQPLIVWQTTN